MARETYVEPPLEIPIVAEPDVLVCGGGPAGVAAALAASRHGATTMVVDGQICLGGIPWEMLRTLIDRGFAQEPVICSPQDWMNYWLVFDPEAMKRLLDELVVESGAMVRLATQVVRPIVDAGRVSGAILESKSGREAVRAKIVIDCTGDAFPGMVLSDMYDRIVNLPTGQARKLENYYIYEPFFPKQVFPKMMFTSEQERRLSVLRTDIHSYIEQMTAKWIVGDEPLDDAAWDNYLAQLERMGLEELLEIYQSRYDAYVE